MDGSPAWSYDGLIAVGNAHKKWVKVTFAHGAQLEDLDKILNNGFEGNARRAIDYFKVDAPKLRKLVRAAIAYNRTILSVRLHP